MMLPPLFLSVRVPTLLARLWRALFFEKLSSGLRRRGRRSIIIFRLDAMGDVVMTTPFFRELRHAYPKSHCTVVVQHAFRPLLVTNPYVDEILTLPKVRAAYLPRRARKLAAAMLLYWRHLRKKSYDIAISPRWDLDEHLATLLCLLTNATERVGYTEKTSPMKQQLNRGFDAAFSICLSAGPVQHEVMRNLAIVEALGGAVQDCRLEVRLTERDREFAARLLVNVPASTQVIALGIGANSSGRRWPINRYADAVSRLARQAGVEPVIVCSADEREQALELAAMLGGCENSAREIAVDGPKCVREKSSTQLVVGEEVRTYSRSSPAGANQLSPGRKPWVEWKNQESLFRDGTVLIHTLLGRKTIILSGVPLREACAVLERCDLFIGNDSGTAHLAAAMDCKAIIISRHPRNGNPNHSNSPLRFGPYCREARVLQPATGSDACTGGCRVMEPHCIKAVSVDDVVSTAQAMLGGSPARAERPDLKVLLNCHHEPANPGSPTSAGVALVGVELAREGSAFGRNVMLPGARP